VDDPRHGRCGDHGGDLVATVTSCKDLSSRELEQLASDYMRGAKVARRPTCVQLPRMGAIWAYVTRRSIADPENLRHPDARRLARRHVERGFGGTFVHTTWPQLAEAVGLTPIGMGAKRAGQLFESRLRATMSYLIAAGCVEGWDVIHEGREPVGILVRVARPCSSAG
jgi:hypothetical protein